MNERRRWRRLVPSFSLRTLLELVFVCAVLVYVWKNQQRDNIIRPDYMLQIEVAGTFVDTRISGLYLVDPDGYVNLGAMYGKVNVLGITGDEAEKAVLTQLRKMLANPQVTVSIAGVRDSWELQQIQSLEREVEQLKLERLSYERKQQGLRDPQGPVESVRR